MIGTKQTYTYIYILKIIFYYLFFIDDREFQLVTWSKDQNLRLWPVPEEITKVKAITKVGIPPNQ